MCLGAYSPSIAKQLNINLPIYPLKGYSISFDIRNPEEAPKCSITDVTSKVVFSRLGNRLRVAGTAEFAGYNEEVTDHRIKMMQDLVRENFPMLGDVAEVTPYACLRPSTPDGVPILGKCRYDNMLLNTGHGTLGWTQTFSSAQIITDIVNKETPRLPLQWYSMERFS
jgi:D-amino-acid dehydrogenase